MNSYDERGLPRINLTKSEFNGLPRCEELESGFWRTCKLGFMYRYGGRGINRSGVGVVVDVEYYLLGQGNLGDIASNVGRHINHYVPVLR